MYCPSAAEAEGSDPARSITVQERRPTMGTEARPERQNGSEGDERASRIGQTERERPEAWSIALHPYPPRPAHELLENLSSSASGCL